MSDGGMGAWDVAAIAARNIGGRVADGLVERHTGIRDIGLSGAVDVAGGMIVPMVKEAYSRKPDEGVLQVWDRRIKWSLGIGAGLALIGGAGWLGWRYLRKPADEGSDG